MTYFEDIGGETALFAIIDEFVDRMVRDPMIGFLFSRVSIPRLKQLEYEHTAVFLGAPLTYTGRDLGRAHGRHPILGGHFHRRQQLLRQTLDARKVPQPIAAAWLAHQDELRSLVMGEAPRDDASPPQPRTLFKGKSR